MKLIHVFFLTIFTGVCIAQSNLETGISAYKQGDYQKATRILAPLAERADSRAMIYIGQMNELGQGVAKDELQAFAWYYLALEEGNMKANDYLYPLEKRLGDGLLDAAMTRVDELREEIAANVAGKAGRKTPPVGKTIDDQQAPQRSSDVAQWQHQQFGAVSLRYPSDWRLQPISRNGQILLSGPENQIVIIWPFYIQIGLSVEGAGELLKKFAFSLDPQLMWEAVEPIDQHTLRCRGKGRDHAGLIGMYRNSGRGKTAGQVYYVGAPDKVLHDQRQTYVQILKSIKIKGGATQDGKASPQRAPAISYRRYMDPAEQSFTIDAPQGWHVRGGLVRRSSVDVTKAVRFQSPDRQIELFIGDGNVPVYTVPNQILLMSGLNEGSWYTPGYGVRMMVMRYMSGAAFASQYVRFFLGRAYASCYVNHNRDRPDASRLINQIYQRYNMANVRQQLSTGEAHFRCSRNGRLRQGYVFAGTSLLQMPQYNSGIWQVDYLYGYVAAPEKISEARAIMAHVVNSMQLNPSWVQMQQGITGKVSNVVSRTNRAISNIISQNYQSQQRAHDESARRFSNYILGAEDVRDPSSGRTYKVESSANYYWIDAGGAIFGTNLSTNPDPMRFEQMISLP